MTLITVFRRIRRSFSRPRAHLAGLVWSVVLPLLLTSHLHAQVAQPGFETPIQPGLGFDGFEQANGTGNGTLAGTAWTFSPNAGISRNGSAFQGSGETAPEGQQIGLIQSTGSISQALSGLVPGETYSVSLARRRRVLDSSPPAATDLQVSVDGNLIGGGQIQGNTFLDYTTATFVANSANPTLSIASTNPFGGDRTLFVDNVRVNSLGVPSAPTLTNPSFEQGTPSDVFPEYGPVDGWATASVGTGSNDAAGPFVNGLPVPDGSRVGFIQRDTGGIRELSQTITGLTPGERYTIEYFENERGVSATAVARPSVTVDGNVIVAEHDAVRTDSFRRVVSDSFVATSSSATLSLRNNVGLGDNTALFDDLQVSRAVPVIANGGFETPVQPGDSGFDAFEQANGIGNGTLAGSVWTFSGGAGISRNISAFQNAGIPAPEGEQHAILQGLDAEITQLVGGFEVGERYSLSLEVKGRNGQNGGNNLQVVLDPGGPNEQVILDIPEVTNLDQFITVDSAIFQAFDTDIQLLVRSNLDGLSGDRTTFVDDLRFNFITTPIPEPSSAAVLVGLFVGSLGLRRRSLV